MKQGKKILTDAHGDEVLHLHRDILDADLTAAEKIMMAALRKQAFTTGRITLHYPDIAVLAHMPLSTVKNKSGIMDRLRKKGWIRGVVKDGACIKVRMSPGWRSKSGEPSDFDVCAGTEPAAPDPEKGGTEPVPGGTEPVPGAVLNRYQSGTEPVPPSENEDGMKGVESKDESEAPVALTGYGPPRPGAPLNKKEETETANAAPALTPALAGALRAEAEAWTMQVADCIGSDRKVSWGVDVWLPRPGRNPLVVLKTEPVGSKPWDEDVRKVYAFAVDRYPDADPVLAFRAVIREPARYKAQRQQILGHALRMQGSQGYDRPQIKLCSLIRLDNSGKDVPDSVHAMGKEDTRSGSLLQRAQDVADTVPVPCFHAPDPQIEADLRRMADRGGLYSAPCWDGCWKEASARFAAAGLPMSAYIDYINGLIMAETAGKSSPRPWLMDSVDPQDMIAVHMQQVEGGLDFCDNWDGGAGQCQDARETEEYMERDDGSDPAADDAGTRASAAV